MVSIYAPQVSLCDSSWSIRFQWSKRLAGLSSLRPQFDPEMAATYYNLGCFRALAGDPNGALDALERAAEMDAESVRKWSENDSDLDSIRDDPRFAELLSPRS